MKKSEIIIACVGLVLVFAVLFGVGAFLTNYDEMIDDFTNPSDGTNNPSDGTNKPSDGTNKPSDDTNNPSDGTNKPSGGTNNDTSDSVVTPSNPDYFMEGDIGYITKDGITTFFVAASAPEDLNLEYGCYKLWTLRYISEDVKVYNNAVLAHKYSLDGGATWTDFHENAEKYQDIGVRTDCSMKIDGDLLYVSTSIEILIAYTQIQNCSNPMEYLTYLRENVFNKKIPSTSIDRVFCDACGGEYYTYEGFCWYASHKDKPDENGAVG